MRAFLEETIDVGGEFGMPDELWVALAASYNPQLVDCIKFTFAGRDRRWDPKRKMWFVRAELREGLLNLLSMLGYEVVWKRPPQSRTSSTPAAASDDYILLQILPDACPEVARAAYKALCMRFHPDRGGDGQKMKEINAAWSRLSKKLGI